MCAQKSALRRNAPRQREMHVWLVTARARLEKCAWPRHCFKLERGVIGHINNGRVKSLIVLRH